jgi:hypothetical protein
MWSKVAVIVALVVSFTTVPVHGQRLNEWVKQKKTQKAYLIQQIAALKVYLKYLKDGYKIVRKGMALVGDIKEGNFNSHKEYFASLRNVNRVVSFSPNASRIVYLQSLTVRLVNKLQSDLETSGLAEEEIKYLKSVCDNILVVSEHHTEELETLLTDGKLVLKDDERLARLDNLHKGVLNCFTFTKTLSDDTRMLVLQREIDRIKE